MRSLAESGGACPVNLGTSAWGSVGRQETSRNLFLALGGDRSSPGLKFDDVALWIGRINKGQQSYAINP